VYKDIQEDDEDKLLPALKSGEKLKLSELKSEQHFTQPPSRFTEAALVRDMEEKNIGRPSTYVPIIATLLDRKYLVREKKILIPTDLGFIVTELMEKYFNQIVDTGFTADLEDKLDDVEAKHTNWKNIIDEFYATLKDELDVADSEIEKVKIEDQLSGDMCEHCGKPMAIKQGRFGEFLACTGYPDCKNTKPIVNKIDVKCPVCEKDIVARKGKSGKLFFGCSGYPECNQVYWNKPVNKTCKECGSLLVEKKLKDSKLSCSNSECKYKE